jgi:hypothetical protein
MINFDLDDMFKKRNDLDVLLQYFDDKNKVSDSLY